MSRASKVILPTQARRLAVAKQRLSGPRPAPDTSGMMDVLRDIRCLQLDPISAVARSHLLVLWSRLGPYDPALLDKLLYADKQLFEYWAHAASIVLMEDYPVHNHMMRRYRAPEEDGAGRMNRWMLESADLHGQIRDRLAAEGPMLSRQFQDNSSSGWQSTGWTNGRNVSRMLDFMWTRGEIMVAGRSGLQKMWDLTERCLPPWAPKDELDQAEVTYQGAQRSLRALGVARAADIKLHYIRYRYAGLEKALQRLEAEGRIERVRIVEGKQEWPGTWYVHSEDMPLLDKIGCEWEPRTTLLSPFDNLICDRARTEQLFNFNFRIEIYVPKEQRKYGYYVLPILHGDRLIGRVDPTMDRKNKRLNINAVFAEPDAPMTDDTGKAIAGANRELAAFLGAREIVYSERTPEGWKTALQ